MEERHMESEQTFLSSLSSDFVRIRDKKGLFEVLNGKLKNMFSFHRSGIGIVDKSKKIFTAFLLDAITAPTYDPDYVRKLREGIPYGGAIIEQILEADFPIVFDMDEWISETAPEYIKVNYALGIRESAMVALRREGESFGFFVLHSKSKGVFTAHHLNILHALSNLLSMSLSNIIRNEAILERDSDQQLILSLSKNLTSTHNKTAFLEIVENTLRLLFPFDELTISRLDEEGSTHSAYISKLTESSQNHPDYQERSNQKYPVADGIYDALLESEKPLLYDMDELVRRGDAAPYVRFFHENGMREMMAIPLRENNLGFGGIFIYMKHKEVFSERRLNLLQGIVSQISIGVSNIWSYEKIERQLEEINRYKSQLEEENYYLQEQIKATHTYSEMIGASTTLQHVFELVSMVSSSDSTVLISGETGTGKELVAKAIHNASAGKEKPMIKVNCAALPPNLIESELFGHEKGSFTGATDRRIGKFELANNNTLFLDEIGEMPLELQVKLLRAIQEKEIERVGGSGTIKTNTRIIAATNRNLRTEVAAGKFRSDLYYRLNVFPIHLPPLRERKEDIPILASHFIALQTQKTGKAVSSISNYVLNAMMRYDWPGNIRELEHLIERSVLMATGPVIKYIELHGAGHGAGPGVGQGPRARRGAETGQGAGAVQGTDAEQEPGQPPGNFHDSSRMEMPPVKTLEEIEREHILSVLRSCGYKVGGPGGAAEMLKIPATTLHSRIKKLGFKKPRES